MHVRCHLVTVDCAPSLALKALPNRCIFYPNTARTSCWWVAATLLFINRPPLVSVVEISMEKLERELLAT